MCACSLIDCYKNTKQCARNPSRSDQDSNGDKSGIHQTFNFRNNNINHGANLTVKSILLQINTDIFMSILKFAFHAHL